MRTTRKLGVREAKARLSYLLREAQQGREYTITDRGKEVAKIVPVDKAQQPLAERIRGLEEAGIIEPGPNRPIAVPPPLPIEHGLARRLLDQDRGA
jgi:prevent-host-death family protein